MVSTIFWLRRHQTRIESIGRSLRACFIVGFIFGIIYGAVWLLQYDQQMQTYTEPEPTVVCYPYVLQEPTNDGSTSYLFWSVLDENKQETRIMVPKTGFEVKRNDRRYTGPSYFIDMPTKGQPLCWWSHVENGKLTNRIATSLERVKP
jgi:hypothetical protein